LPGISTHWLIADSKIDSGAGLIASARKAATTALLHRSNNSRARAPHQLAPPSGPAGSSAAVWASTKDCTDEIIQGKTTVAEASGAHDLPALGD
jgi:hypothetical protein